MSATSSTTNEIKIRSNSKYGSSSTVSEPGTELHSLHSMLKVLGDQLSRREVMILKRHYRSIVPDHILRRVADGFSLLLSLEKYGQLDETNMRQFTRLLGQICRYDLLRLVKLHKTKPVPADPVSEYMDRNQCTVKRSRLSSLSSTSSSSPTLFEFLLWCNARPSKDFYEIAQLGEASNASPATLLSLISSKKPPSSSSSSISSSLSTTSSSDAQFNSLSDVGEGATSGTGYVTNSQHASTRKRKRAECEIERRVMPRSEGSMIDFDSAGSSALQEIKSEPKVKSETIVKSEYEVKTEAVVKSEPMEISEESDVQYDERNVKAEADWKFAHDKKFKSKVKDEIGMRIKRYAEGEPSVKMEAGVKIEPRTRTSQKEILPLMKPRKTCDIRLRVRTEYSDHTTALHGNVHSNKQDPLRRQFEMFFQANTILKSRDLGCILCDIKFTELTYLDAFWRDYVNGSLQKALRAVFITQALQQVVGQEDVKLLISIDEENYEAGRRILLSNMTEEDC